MSQTHEAVTVVLPVRDLASTVVQHLERWTHSLASLHRPWDLVVVDDGSTDGTLDKARSAFGTNLQIVFVQHEKPLGLGASLRTAMERSIHPLFFYATADYPYNPADLKRLLERIETSTEFPHPETGDIVQLKPDVVCGARTGVPVPKVAKWCGWLYRWFCRIVLGLPLEKLPGWYGFREHLRSWWLWIVYGVPLDDPTANFKLIRRSVLDRFPIQSDGEFAIIEIIAKCTFLTCTMDELPLTPRNQAIPHAAWSRTDRRKVFNNPKFVKATPTAEVAIATG